MSEAAAQTTPAAAPKTTEATIHDAIDAMFASKEPAAPKTEQAKTEAPAAEAAPATERMAEPEAPTEPAEEPKLPEAPKVSATDYALKLAKIKKREQASANLAPAVSADAIKRAAAIEAAGGDPVKAFEAAGFDLATIVQAYDKKMADEPNNADPLAKEVKKLQETIADMRAQADARDNEAATSEFFRDAQAFMSAKGDAFEYVAAYGQEGLDVVKELVLKSSKKGKVLPLPEALRLAEEYYEGLAQPLLQTKKLQSKFATTPTKKPSIPQQAPVTTPAPTAPTKPKSVSDVISNELDALMGR